MLVILCCVVVLIIGIVLFNYNPYNLSGTMGLLVTLVGGFCLFFSLLLLPLQHFCYNAHIRGFNAVQETVNESRKAGINIEDAALKLKIVDQNMWLAETKYYNSTVWDIWIPDAIENLEPIR